MNNVPEQCPQAICVGNLIIVGSASLTMCSEEQTFRINYYKVWQIYLICRFFNEIGGECGEQPNYVFSVIFGWEHHVSTEQYVSRRLTTLSN
jgi:hypothetical protein